MGENLRGEGFDPLALWEAVGQDGELLRDVVQIFAAEYPVMLFNLEQAAKTGDVAGVQNVSHKLKGALLQLAASKAAAAAVHVEDSAIGKSPQELAPLIDELKVECDSLLQLLLKIDPGRSFS